MRNELLLVSFLAVLAVALVDRLAQLLYLYWTVWWFDNLVHFLGGLAVGLFFFWIFKKFFAHVHISDLKRLMVIITLIVVCVGIGWEIYEYVFDISTTPLIGETYFQDTSYDLISALAGAVLAALFIYKRRLYG